MSQALRVLIIGYGRMGKVVEQLAPGEGIEIVGRVDINNANEPWPDADVAIDFSVPDAVPDNFKKYAARKINAVVGATGWHAREAEMRAIVEKAGIGVVVSGNLSIGVNLFQMMVAEAARLMKEHHEYGAWIHEAHHSAKKDAPSGTALLLRDAMTRSGFERPVDMSSTRAGAIPGIHTIGFDSVSDTIELTHTARDRGGFGRGALLAAKWVHGTRGWYSMSDVLGRPSA
jgi:4-hydroxy-tetrahydrodipicolinate reductase